MTIRKSMATLLATLSIAGAFAAEATVVASHGDHTTVARSSWSSPPA